ncbi:hypothetical protein [Porphyromonas endodontalis]|uniref:hypothetical protein n=1 Tax=Porphyromonas endodontalis TaxID=28124 RepID=UPI003FA0BE23
MITKSTNRSGERREQNLRIHEDRMDLLGTIHEMIEAEFVRREEGQWGSKLQPRAPSAPRHSELAPKPPLCSGCLLQRFRALFQRKGDRDKRVIE